MSDKNEGDEVFCLDGIADLLDSDAEANWNDEIFKAVDALLGWESASEHRKRKILKICRDECAQPRSWLSWCAAEALVERDRMKK